MRQDVLDFSLEIKALKDDGTFAGHGSVFDVVDSTSERVAKGAFRKSLAAHKRSGRMPALLWQHDARQPIGIWDTMREDDVGLYVEGRLLKDDVRQAAEAHALLKAGALSGLSIGFMTEESEADEKKGIRTLTRVDLWEVSLVTFPANDAARVEAVKAAEIITIRDLERALRDAGYSRKEAESVCRRFEAKATAPQGEPGGNGADELAASFKRAVEALTR